MSILIVDDEPLMQSWLSGILEDAGYSDTLTCDSAARALEKLGADDASGTSWRVDLILMDIDMGDMSGIEACRRVKEMPHLKDVPVIMVTGMVKIEYLEEAFAAGAMDYITKPPRPPELLARVNSALRLKHEADARKKRLRRLREYVRQVRYVIDAAAAVEAATFDPASLADVAARRDALGRLAQVFQRMACEVAERERIQKVAAYDLHITIDKVGMDAEVERISQSDYFQMLAERSRQLRASKDTSGTPIDLM